MTSVNHLAEIMITEAELTEQVAEIMKQQQHALVVTDAEAVSRSADQLQELLFPIEGLEQERMRMTQEIWTGLTGLTTDQQLHFSALVSHLTSDDAARISAAGSRLHAAVEHVMALNQANQFLMEHSRKFVNATIRIVTDGYTRQLVDHKI